MKSSQTKILCKFRQKCRNFKENKQCKFSHVNFTEGKGYQHTQLIQQLQQHATTTQATAQNRFQKPKHQTQCKFGTKCNKRINNKCPFKHAESSDNAEGKKAESSFFHNKADILCRFGEKCTAFPQGKCLYKHQNSQPVAEEQPTSQTTQNDIFEKICIGFLLNKICEGNCQKLHQFTQTKAISRLFSIEGCQKQITKIMIMQPYQPEQPPLYIIVLHNKISFAQLFEAQSSSQGTQNPRKANFIMKKYSEKDIQFEGQYIQNAWLVKIQVKGERTDLIVCKTSNSIKMVFLGQNSYIDLSTEQAILNVISIDSFVIILFNNGKTASFQYDFSINTLKYRGEPFEQKFSLIKKCNNRFNDAEIVAGVSVDNNLCFINKQLNLYKMKLNESQSVLQLLADIIFFQISNCPYALVLTSLGKIYAVNLLSFQTHLFLETNLSNSDFKFSCLALTNQHLFIAIETLGILVYNMQKQKQPNGVLAIDSLKWKMETDLSGNLVLASENQSGRRDISIFKVARLEND